MRAFVVFILLMPSIGFAQDLVCCDKLFIRVGGDWVGAPRDCDERLATLPPETRAKACAQILGSGLECATKMKSCDCAAVDAFLKAEYERWLKVRREVAANADDMHRETIDAIHRGREAMAEQLKEDLWIELPLGVTVYTAQSKEDAVEVAIKVLEDAAQKADIEKGVAQRATKLAGGAASVADFVLDWGAVLLKIRLSLAESDRYAKEALSASEGAQQATKKAYDAWKQREAAEKACEEKAKAKRLDGAPPDPNEFDDDVQTWMAVRRELHGAIESNEAAIAAVEDVKKTIGSSKKLSEKQRIAVMEKLATAFRSEARAGSKLRSAEAALKR